MTIPRMDTTETAGLRSEDPNSPACRTVVNERSDPSVDGGNTDDDDDDDDNDEKKSNSKRQKRKGISPLKPVKIEDEGMGISI